MFLYLFVITTKFIKIIKLYFIESMYLEKLRYQMAVVLVILICFIFFQISLFLSLISTLFSNYQNEQRVKDMFLILGLLSFSCIECL